MALGTVSSLFTPEPNGNVNTNGMWIGVTSPTYLEPDFKYCIRLNKKDLDTGIVNTQIGQFKVPPNPVDGNGYFSPHRILKSNLKSRVFIGVATSSTLPFTQSVWSDTENHVMYNYDIGFEYQCNIVGIVRNNYPNPNVYIQFGQPHQFLQGDVIRVQKYNNNYDGYVNGIATITGVTTYNIYLDKDVNYQITNDNCVINYISRYTTNVNYSSRGNDSLYAIDGVLPATYSFDKGGFYTKPLVNIEYGENNILTDWKEPRYIFPYENESVGYIGNYSETANRIERIRYTVYSSNYPSNSVIAASVSVSALYYSQRYRHFQVVTGSDEVSKITGITSSMKWYTVEILGNSGASFPVRGRVTRIIDNSCTPYENIRICWLNKKGAYDFFTFTYGSTYKTNTNKTEVKLGMPFNYNLNTTNGNRQTHIFSVNSETIYTMESDWVDEYTYKQLENLFESPEVYIIDGVDYSKTHLATNPTPRVTPIIILSKEYESKTTQRDALFNVKIDYKLAFDKVLHNR